MVDQEHLRCADLPVYQLSLRNKSFLQEFDGLIEGWRKGQAGQLISQPGFPP